MCLWVCMLWFSYNKNCGWVHLTTKQHVRGVEPEIFCFYQQFLNQFFADLQEMWRLHFVIKDC